MSAKLDMNGIRTLIQTKPETKPGIEIAAKFESFKARFTARVEFSAALFFSLSLIDVIAHQGRWAIEKQNK